jgi:hypothetical protein
MVICQIPGPFGVSGSPAYMKELSAKAGIQQPATGRSIGLDDRAKQT